MTWFALYAVAYISKLTTICIMYLQAPLEISLAIICCPAIIHFRRISAEFIATPSTPLSYQPKRSRLSVLDSSIYRFEDTGPPTF